MPHRQPGQPPTPDSAYVQAVTRGLQGLQAVSTGACPGCPKCAELAGFETTLEGLAAHSSAWHRGDADTEASFSWAPCRICGTTLGGDREVFHAIQGNPGEDLKGREILHLTSCCVDCVFYLAYGTEPESWRRS